jgi:hypothetical protein
MTLTSKWMTISPAHAGFSTGVIDIACWHLVKDWMDIPGVRWGLERTESFLTLRSLCLFLSVPLRLQGKASLEMIFSFDSGFPNR